MARERQSRRRPARGREEGGRYDHPSTGGLDFEVLRQAIEGRDAETLVGLYADDAEVITVNRSTTPSSPNVLRVLGAGTLKVRDGKIVRQVNVEAWDE